ncbi:MAG: hypothetical protein KJ065_17885 [Anaerolineae bacterium]|nr:hypothetical protein [Anaerolineae bacterium]
MGIKVRGCVGYVVVFNLFIVSAMLGWGAGLLGWILPSLLVAVAYMFVQMIFDVILLMMGAGDAIDSPYAE